jgi:hypothetical protein
MIINRVWEMPNKYTFKMKCVQELISRYTKDGKRWVDPFCGYHSIAEWTNDIDEEKEATSHNDGVLYLKSLFHDAFDGAFFDPPYSPEQCLRLYTPTSKRSGKASWGTGGKATYHAECKDEIARIIKPNGITISFGWDTNGIGKTRGFEIIEVLDICHGACHNDTLITVERKL